MPTIHATAMVDPAATLAEDVVIGPYCQVSGPVTLAEGVVLKANVMVEGPTTLGARTVVYPFACLGFPPQDVTYKDEPTRLEIGADAVIREQVTMHRGTVRGGGLTRVGDRGLFMVGSHVAHDCQVADDVVFANHATLGGHVQVGSGAILGGLAAVHQRSRIGRCAMVGGMSGVEGDVIPFGSVMGNRARLSGLNLVGLKRRNFSRDDIHALRSAYRLLFAQEGTLAERLEDAQQLYADNAAVMEVVRFVAADSARPLCQPGWGNGF